MANLVIILTLVILLQLIFSLYQLRYYQRFMRRLLDKYQDRPGFRLVSEIIKTGLSSHVLVVIYNGEKKISEAYYLDGVMVFSRFKPYDAIVGLSLDECLAAVAEAKKQTAKTRALANLVTKYK
ncbi:transcriptional regulator GutM [Streptococcus sp. H49]|uniref:transcriptional regulator GutM n=1 Tax=Streptococcus huangxiaojuni TaxID=3237239 RepID=UPI0034A1C6A9